MARAILRRSKNSRRNDPFGVRSAIPNNFETELYCNTIHYRLMLEDHKRAAMMVNDGHVTWHHFVRSRFSSRQSGKTGDAGVSIDIQMVSLQSSLHAEIQGLLEYFTGASLPVVFEFAGTLDLESREVMIDGGADESRGRSFSGRFSENGRVLELRPREPGKHAPEKLHLVHENTIEELFGTL